MENRKEREIKKKKKIKDTRGKKKKTQTKRKDGDVKRNLLTVKHYNQEKKINITNCEIKK